MKVLVVGSGGREHALVWKFSQSPKVKKIYCAPGNAGTAGLAENIPIQAEDIPKLLEFALEKKIGLTVVGPEAPLTEGIVDLFTKKDLRTFGAAKKAAEIEGSKSFAKKLMTKNNVDTTLISFVGDLIYFASGLALMLFLTHRVVDAARWKPPSVAATIASGEGALLERMR